MKYKLPIKLSILTLALVSFILLLLGGLIAVTNWYSVYTFKFHAPIEINFYQPIRVVKWEIISPIVELITEVKEPSLTLTNGELDKWIGECSDRFANKNKTPSMLRYQLHCLANKETGHKSTLKCGDGGLSCGLYQYKQATWLGFRNLMKKEGLITDISSRDDDKQAVFTTAWALSNNRDGNWGPWVRGECQ